MDGYACAQNIATTAAWYYMTNRTHEPNVQAYLAWYFEWLSGQADAADTGLWCSKGTNRVGWGR